MDAANASIWRSCAGYVATPSPLAAFWSDCHAWRLARTASPHRPTLRPCVRRHVVEVAGARYRIAEVLRARHRPLGLGRQLRRVDVEMTGARVANVTLQRALEHAQQTHSLSDPRDRAFRDEAAAGTTLPHTAWRRPDRRDRPRQRGSMARAYARSCSTRLAGSKCSTYRTPIASMNAFSFGLACRSASATRLLNGGIRTRRLVRGHSPVDVRPPGPGFAPVADRALRVALLRFAKRSAGLHLGKGVHQLEALIEVGLRLRVRRGDGPRELPQADGVEPNRLVEVGRQGPLMVLRRRRRPEPVAERPRTTAMPTAKTQNHVARVRCPVNAPG